ncbi:hypothetical protein [Saccharopolyspora erythraea]|nr:hypothetical protein [Saccharopolyspora erythraea]
MTLEMNKSNGQGRVKPGGKKDGRKAGRGQKPGPKPGSKNRK